VPSLLSQRADHKINTKDWTPDYHCRSALFQLESPTSALTPLFSSSTSPALSVAPLFSTPHHSSSNSLLKSTVSALTTLYESFCLTVSLFNSAKPIAEG
jgi:hypothetical protein